MKQLDLLHLEAPALLQLAWDDGASCPDCPKYHEWQEHHPYGMGTAAETLNECTADKVDDCPWVERKLREQAAYCEDCGE